ncbi:MAG: hypothetical protein A2Y56_05440 [Candidatus Aminicenantes bacterium RBG_13_63_10]|nr:MAG: hypothetical protein A2Y56_05440 [Candidatus Aminicenantes bacterium RBG_13_63_10]
MSGSKPRLIMVKVQPRAKRREVAADEDGALTVKVLAAPDRGRANAEVLELLAEHLGLPVSRMRIVRGEKSRHKLVAVDG